MAKGDMEDRLQKAKDKQNKRLGIVPSPSTSPAMPSAETKPSGDQKPAPASKAGDQNDASKATKKAKKKPSPGYLVYKSTKLPEPTAKIKVLVSQGDDCPKKRNARTKFDIYENGMTVAEYVEASHAKLKTPKATAQADVRWDLAHGFISVK